MWAQAHEMHACKQHTQEVFQLSCSNVHFSYPAVQSTPRQRASTRHKNLQEVELLRRFLSVFGNAMRRAHTHPQLARPHSPPSHFWHLKLPLCLFVRRHFQHAIFSTSFQAYAAGGSKLWVHEAQLETHDHQSGTGQFAQNVSQRLEGNTWASEKTWTLPTCQAQETSKHAKQKDTHSHVFRSTRLGADCFYRAFFDHCRHVFHCFSQQP